MTAEDLNDILRREGPGAIRAQLDEAVLNRRKHTNGCHYEIPDGFVSDETIKAQVQPQLIKKTLPERGSGLTIGQSGAGKSAVVIDMACAIASGSPFFGRNVRHRGGVVYLAAEGGGGIENRFAAAKINRGLSNPLPIVYTTKVGDLTDDVELDKLIQNLKQIDRVFRQRFGVPHRLTIIDTMSVAFPMHNENDNAEVAAVCRRLQRIDEETGAFALGVHHAGKNIEAGARGGSAWRGNVDNVLSCLADRCELTGECTNRRLILSKYRDGPEGPIGAYDLKFIELGEDEDGEPFDAPAISFVGSITKATKRLSQSQQIFDEALTDALLAFGKKHRVKGDGPLVEAVDVQAVRLEFVKRYGTGEEDRVKRAHKTKVAFQRLLKDLAGRYGIEATPEQELIWKLSA